MTAPARPTRSPVPVGPRPLRTDATRMPRFVLASWLALFVNGCFWHGHDCARGARVPKQNRDYWVAKVGRNVARDAKSREALAGLGWQVETIWECDLKDAAVLEGRLATLLARD